MKLRDDVAQAVAALRDAIHSLHRQDFGEESPQELRPGADAAAIETIRPLFGGRVPPSYAAFLEQHDGWLKFSGGQMVLPIAERQEPWVAKRLSELRELLDQSEEVGILDDAVILCLGPEEPDFVLYDLREPTEDGEFEVVHFDLIEGELDRYDSFLEFLAGSAEDLD